MALGAAAIYAAAMLTSDEWSQWPQDKRMDMIRTIDNATRVIISSGVQPSDLTSAGKELLKRVHTQR